ncbi:hypothetical protein FOXB_16871 [Fusarium oxysporum f. sp. conglutinans Fo5176]|uniref:HAT C-terminal dimerisation domain-containing protein n=1 Tax=Fusarium oxysporum (strain Fo5176) TaxID=660025 RepID=F9GDY7_FUSOF|nr:hypothetical protein FOXB_16871 [Fusarium oxysporum f. sp. conglutinans Fo5176]
MEGLADATQWEEYYWTRLKKMWKEEYTNREVPSLAMLSTAAAERGSLDMTLSWHSRSAITKGRIQRRPALDEYERYIHTFTPADDKYQFSPLSWWQEHQMKYPNLSQMAFDLLSIPTISAETERSFSSAGKMLQYDSNLALLLNDLLMYKSPIAVDLETPSIRCGPPFPYIVIGMNAESVEGARMIVRATSYDAI